MPCTSELLQNHHAAQNEESFRFVLHGGFYGSKQQHLLYSIAFSHQSPA
jgi:hypothetical protein